MTFQEAPSQATSVEWYTPPELAAKISAFLNPIDLDPCADPEHRIPATRHFTTNGLKMSWGHTHVYMNPPYGRGIEQWIDKALKEPVFEIIMLVPARPGSKWFQKLFRAGCSFIFIAGRLKFAAGEPDRAKHGGTQTGMFDSVLVYRGYRHESFRAAFAYLGAAALALPDVA